MCLDTSDHLVSSLPLPVDVFDYFPNGRLPFPSLCLRVRNLIQGSYLLLILAGIRNEDCLAKSTLRPFPQAKLVDDRRVMAAGSHSQYIPPTSHSSIP